MKPLPDPPPAPMLWPRAAAALPGASRWPRRLASGLAGLVAVLLLAAWGVPPLLDWGRFRTGFAAIAAAQLGRPVQLGGQVTLRLLPEAVLTATDVLLPDQGDGVSAQLGAMRLQVAMLPLLAGRIVPRDLVLGTPVLRLPWPLPQAMTHPARPLVPRAFAAHIEGGTLRIGQLQVTGINAGIHGGPEPGSVAVPPDWPAGAFGAEGFAAFGGRIWRFTSALGAPDADGVSALDLSVTGQGAAGRTGGSVQGTLAMGVVQGRLRAGGTDLSLLLPAAGLPWHVEAPFTADNDRFEANAVALSLGAFPANASLVLRLAAPTRLDGKVHAAALNLDGWAGLLAAAQAGGIALPALPFRMVVAADTARLLAGNLAALQGVLASDGTSLDLDHAEATLPGQARLQVGGAITHGPGGLQLSGPASLDAPDLHTTLAWLHAAPSLADGATQAVLRRAHLAGRVRMARRAVAVTDLSGEVDGAGVSGGFGVTLGATPHVSASLTVSELSLDDWLGRIAPDTPMAAIGRRFAQLAADLHVKADRASWYGVTLNGLALDARTGPAGLVIDRAEAGLSGAKLSAKGALGPDGSVAGASLAASTPDAAPLLGLLPAAWRFAPGLWNNAASLKAALSGPPQSLGGQLRADAGDLVLEADWRADALHTLAGTVTLRHPGAPRLLASLGLPGAERWMDAGSLALRAQVSIRQRQFSVPDFDLAAGLLRLSGRLDADMSAGPFLRGSIAAETLALPGPADAKAVLDWLPRWTGQLTVAAQSVSVGGSPAITGLAAGLGSGGGDGLLDVTQASVLGGQWTGQVALAVGGNTPLLAAKATLTGAHISGPVFGLPIDLAAGDADALLDLQAQGADPAAWRASLTGQAAITLRNAQLRGFDLAQAGHALARPGRAARAALQTALSGGATPGLSGGATLDAAHGRIGLAPATLTSSDGAVLVQGWADGGALNATFGLIPTGATAAQPAIRMFGPFGSVRVLADAGSAGAIPRRSRSSPVQRRSLAGGDVR